MITFKDIGLPLGDTMSPPWDTDLGWANRLVFLNPKGLRYLDGVPHWGGLAAIMQSESVAPVNPTRGGTVADYRGVNSAAPIGGSLPQMYPPSWEAKVPAPVVYPKTVQVKSHGGIVQVDRDEVINAYRQANVPLPTTLPNLTALRYRGARGGPGILIHGAVQRHYAKAALGDTWEQCPWTVVQSDGLGCSYRSVPELLRFWEVR